MKRFAKNLFNLPLGRRTIGRIQTHLDMFQNPITQHKAVRLQLQTLSEISAVPSDTVCVSSTAERAPRTGLFKGEDVQTTFQITYVYDPLISSNHC